MLHFFLYGFGAKYSMALDALLSCNRLTELPL
jgi:hypothetical protein